MLKGKDGKFKALTLNEKVRRAYCKNPNKGEVAKLLNVRYQRVYNVVKKMKLAIVRADFFQQ
jgi:hypothetical protein